MKNAIFRTHRYEREFNILTNRLQNPRRIFTFNKIVIYYRGFSSIPKNIVLVLGFFYIRS